MARFQDLSTELVLGILEKVLPEDIESLSLLSKCVYQLAIPRLEEHRRLRKKYTDFRNKVEYRPHNWCDPGGLLADLLCKIMSDTKIGHYVKKIHLDLWNNGPREGWKPDEVFDKQLVTSRPWLQQDPKTNMEIIEEAIRTIKIIPTEEVDDWLCEIRRGNEDPLVALLLLHAPKIHSLIFVAPYNSLRSSYLLKTIQRGAGQGSTVNRYLSHLKTIEICFAEAWESFEFVKACMSLPSLASIKTDTLFVDGRTHEANSAILPQPSNVTDIFFQSGFLPETVLFELLRGVKNLKTFAYNFTHLWRDEDYRPTFDCLALMTTLEANASHNLEHLILGAEDIQASQIAPTRGFHALREIEFDTNHCLTIEESRIANLIGVLPVSIERLTLRWDEGAFADGVEIFKEAFVALVRESKTQLPHLRTLNLSTRDQAQSDALWDCLGSDETAQMNNVLSFKIQGPNGSGEIPAWVDNVCTCGQDCFGDGSQ